MIEDPVILQLGIPVLHAIRVRPEIAIGDQATHLLEIRDLPEIKVPREIATEDRVILPPEIQGQRETRVHRAIDKEILRRPVRRGIKTPGLAVAGETPEAVRDREPAEIEIATAAVPARVEITEERVILVTEATPDKVETAATFG